MLPTLLLNQSYETISFISLRSLIKLIVKDKVEILSNWPNEEINWSSGYINYPATVRLKYYIHRSPGFSKFNRRAVFRRDMFTCLYCSETLSLNKATIDHLIPTSRGGKSEWKNVATSCLSCNNKKGDKTPEEAGMKLLYEPYQPRIGLTAEYILIRNKHPDWHNYFPEVEHIEPKIHVEECKE